MKPLNFSSGLRSTLLGWASKDKIWERALSILDNSVKFIFPLEGEDGSVTFDNTPYVDLLNKMGGHLPYPCICIETISRNNETGHDVDVVILAYEYQTNGKLFEIMLFVRDRFSGLGWAYSSGGIIEVDEHFHVHCRREIGLPYREEDKAAHIALTMTAWNTIIDLCVLLSCRNVYQEDSRPGFTERNRAAKEKRPIFSYKILVVGATRQPGASTGPVGGRESPRVHLRRGHVRRLSERHGGGITWVNAAVVGSKTGMVHKDYAVVSHGP